MKRITYVFFIGLFNVMLMTMQACSQTNGNVIKPAVYVGITPCSSGTRPVPGIPKETECELIKWELKLFSGKEQEISGTYILDCDYGLPKQGTKGLLHGGKRLHRGGK
ncbi:hypothetical protein OQX61_23110 [Pedobacter sp. PLR]|uniref:hypothetical protein n=1 Tax=Pedobacter sp. PLR TaxID=2994465 RepID=UPI0022472F48|nr:hypothetical protein [Pedobacter sp. PLR]MCX2454179.1 hypothetical protein [Pedobacter sp. PLR]